MGTRTLHTLRRIARDRARAKLAACFRCTAHTASRVAVRWGAVAAVLSHPSRWSRSTLVRGEGDRGIRGHAEARQDTARACMMGSIFSFGRGSPRTARSRRVGATISYTQHSGKASRSTARDVVAARRNPIFFLQFTESDGERTSVQGK